MLEAGGLACGGCRRVLPVGYLGQEPELTTRRPLSELVQEVAKT